MKSGSPVFVSGLQKGSIAMNDETVARKLNWMVYLLAANLVVTFVLAVALVIGLLPKLERAVQTRERVEARFQSFADEVQPVVTAGAGKTIETIKGMESGRLSETATEKADVLLDAAAEKARRFLNRDKADDQ